MPPQEKIDDDDNMSSMSSFLSGIIQYLDSDDSGL